MSGRWGRYVILLMTTSCTANFADMQAALNDPKRALTTTGHREWLAYECLNEANDEARDARASRGWDMGLIILASVFGLVGTANSVASGLISDTHNGGEPSDLKQWTAGIGAVNIAIGGALFALRTALNLSKVATVQTNTATSQAALGARILGDRSDKDADAHFETCVKLTNDPQVPFNNNGAPGNGEGAGK